MSSLRTQSFGCGHTLGVTVLPGHDWSVGAPIDAPHEDLIRRGRRFVAMASNDVPRTDTVWYADVDGLSDADIAYFVDELDQANRISRATSLTVSEAGRHRIPFGKWEKTSISRVADRGHWSYLNWLANKVRGALSVTDSRLSGALDVFLNDPRNNSALVRSMHGHS